ncbi:hypothetical protein MNB_SV-12-35 [hydrothermal vent metagenome]|uniref:Uncharacterized protein n=1 Tax=hydrothermal vent metagenome TaxID=652676 RepID=A0A1W1BNB0_9ZZZZ
MLKEILLEVIKNEFPKDGIEMVYDLEYADCDNCEKNPFYCEEQRCFSIMGSGYGKEKGIMYGLEGLEPFSIRKIID